MNHAERLRVLAFADRRHPCSHSFLDGVMEKRVAGAGAEVVWVMRSNGTHIRLRKATWRKSRIMILPSLVALRLGRLLFEHLLFVLFVPFLLFKCLQIRADIIFVRNDPLYLLFGRVLGALTGAPVVFQLSHLKEEDLLARASESRGVRRISQLLKGHVSRIMRDGLLTGVDHLFVISEAMRDLLLSMNAALPSCSVFPLGVDVGLEREAAIIPQSVRFQRYFIYIGTMAETRNPRVMVDAIKLLDGECADVGLLMVGGGGEPAAREKLKRYVHEKKLEARVQFLDDVPRADLAPLIVKAVGGLSIIPSTGVNRTISPTKLMEYLQFGCPVIATGGIPEQEQIVRESSGGVLVSCAPEAIASAMARLLSSSELRTEMGERGREYITRFRSYDMMAEQVRSIFLRLRTTAQRASS